MIGKLKTINSKGYGFISDDNGIDYFIHYSDYSGDWRQLIQQYIVCKESKTVIRIEFTPDYNSDTGPKSREWRILE